MDENTGGSAPGAGAGAAGAESTGAAGEKSAGRFDRIRGAAQEKYQSASSAVRDQYSAVRGRVDEVDVDEITGKVREYVRENPGKSLLFSVAAGFVIGLMFRQSDED